MNNHGLEVIPFLSYLFNEVASNFNAGLFQRPGNHHSCYGKVKPELKEIRSSTHQAY